MKVDASEAMTLTLRSLCIFGVQKVLSPGPYLLWHKCQAIDFDFDGTLHLLVGWDRSALGLNGTLQALELGPDIGWRSIPLTLPEKFFISLQFVDCDRNGQLDIVVKRIDKRGFEELLLYTRGFCEMPAACNAAARCTADGSCDCPA